MSENQQKLLTLLQRIDVGMADEFEKMVLANDLGIVTNEVLAAKTADISNRAGLILNPTQIEPDPVTLITESRVLELANERVGLIGSYPNIMISIDGSEVAKFDFRDVTETAFVNFLTKHGI
jgi:hypothetical protein